MPWILSTLTQGLQEEKHFSTLKHKTRCIFMPYFDTIAKSFFGATYPTLYLTLQNLRARWEIYHASDIGILYHAIAILDHPNHTVPNHWNWQIKIYQEVFAELDDLAMVEPNTNSMRGRSKPTKSFGELHGSEVYRQTYSAAWPSSMPSGNVLYTASSSPSTLSNNIAGATMAVINMMPH